MTSQEVSWFSDIICYFFIFSERPCTSLRSSFVIKMLQLFSSFAHAASVLNPDTWISLFLSKISKFWTTSNLKITSKNIPRKQKKITEYSKPMNENIICHQGLSFQIWVDYKNFWKKRNSLPSATRMTLGERGFAECRLKTLGKIYVLPSAIFAALGKG